jgi:hypothetical protein
VRGALVFKAYCDKIQYYAGFEYRVLAGKPEGKSPLGRPRCRWEDNIKMDLQDVECGGADWIDLAHERDIWWALVNAEMNLGVV